MKMCFIGDQQLQKVQLLLAPIFYKACYELADIVEAGFHSLEQKSSLPKPTLDVSKSLLLDKFCPFKCLTQIWAGVAEVSTA